MAAGADAGGAAPTARPARGGAAACGAAAQGEGGAATGRGGSNRKMGVTMAYSAHSHGELMGMKWDDKQSWGGSFSGEIEWFLPLFT